ncbi:hypothetical protein OEZ86_002024 [Tetradesmus obliquus]|nr:hypothetical protein OEZ86_002024 [Tetradesmus obliquus]
MTWLPPVAHLPASQTFPVGTQGPTVRQRGMADALPGVFFETSATLIRLWAALQMSQDTALEQQQQGTCPKRQQTQLLAAPQERSSTGHPHSPEMAPQAALMQQESGRHLAAARLAQQLSSASLAGRRAWMAACSAQAAACPRRQELMQEIGLARKGVVGAMQAGDRPTVDQLRRDATKGLLAFLPTAASKVGS